MKFVKNVKPARNRNRVPNAGTVRTAKTAQLAKPVRTARLAKSVSNANNAKNAKKRVTLAGAMLLKEIQIKIPATQEIIKAGISANNY